MELVEDGLIMDREEKLPSPETELSCDAPSIADIPAITDILGQWTEAEEVQKYAERIARAIDGVSEYGMAFWVLKQNNKVIGVGGLADPLPAIKSYAQTENPGELKILYMDGAARGQGKGREFLAFLERAARDSGRSELLVRSAERYRETAFDFYKRCGYEDLGHITNEAGLPMEIFRKDLELKKPDESLDRD